MNYPIVIVSNQKEECINIQRVKEIVLKVRSFICFQGQLKEKKGRWRFLKRWKTRYFTLSGAQITCNKSDSVSESRYNECKVVIICFSISSNICLCAQKNRLNETVILSTTYVMIKRKKLN